MNCFLLVLSHLIFDTFLGVSMVVLENNDTGHQYTVFRMPLVCYFISFVGLLHAA